MSFRTRVYNLVLCTLTVDNLALSFSLLPFKILSFLHSQLVLFTSTVYNLVLFILTIDNLVLFTSTVYNIVLFTLTIDNLVLFTV